MQVFVTTYCKYQIRTCRELSHKDKDQAFEDKERTKDRTCKDKDMKLVVNESFKDKDQDKD